MEISSSWQVHEWWHEWEEQTKDHHLQEEQKLTAMLSTEILVILEAKNMDEDRDDWQPNNSNDHQPIMKSCPLDVPIAVKY